MQSPSHVSSIPMQYSVWVLDSADTVQSCNCWPGYVIVMFFCHLGVVLWVVTAMVGAYSNVSLIV